MVINYQDKNLIVMYLQIVLLEQLGLTVHKVETFDNTYYEITNTDPLVVTGYYNMQTYTALALYMAYNYPNEGYPLIWSYKKNKETNKDEWVSTEYYYQGDTDELVNVIVTNLQNITRNPQVVQVPERVLSYIFNEVVTPISSPEEILRVKQLIYDPVYPNGVPYPSLDYDEVLLYTVADFQQRVIDKYTTHYKTEEMILKTEKGKVSYNIGKRISQVDSVIIESDKLAQVTINGSDGTYKEHKVIDNELVLYLYADEIDSVKIIADKDGQTVNLTTDRCIEVKAGEWKATFDESFGAVSQVEVSYHPTYEYNRATGRIAFIECHSATVKLTKTINDETDLPLQFRDFKVTGYVDPWTEIIIKEGYEVGDEQIFLTNDFR